MNPNAQHHNHPPPCHQTSPFPVLNLSTTIGLGHDETYLKGNKIFEGWVTVVMNNGMWLSFGVIGSNLWCFDGGGWVTGVCTSGYGGQGGAVGLDYGVVFEGVGGCLLTP